MYEKNQHRSEVMGSASMFYSAISVGLVVASIINRNIDILSVGFVFFIVTAIGILISFYMDKIEESKPSVFMLTLGLFLMIPYSLFLMFVSLIVGFVMFIIKFIKSISKN